MCIVDLTTKRYNVAALCQHRKALRGVALSSEVKYLRMRKRQGIDVQFDDVAKLEKKAVFGLKFKHTRMQRNRLECSQ